MANARPARAVREFRTWERSCLTPGRNRVARDGGPAASVPLVVGAAALMVLLAGAAIAAVAFGAPAGAYLALAGVAVLVRPAAVLVHRRRAARPRPALTRRAG